MGSDLAVTKEDFLAVVRQFEAALAGTTSFEQVRAIEAKLEALRQAGVMLGVAADALAACSLAKTRAQVKVGEELARLGMGSGRWQSNEGVTLPPGITRNQSSRYQLLAKFGLPRIEQLRAEVGAENFSLGEILRRAKALFFREKVNQQAAALRAEPIPLPDDKFYVIEADPPWAYGTEYDPKTRRVANPYPEMTVEQIAALPIAERAQENSVLWLWITNRFLLEAAHIPICRAWGFEPKNILTWDKDRMGTGHWMRGQTEHCVLAIRGHPTTLFQDQPTALHTPMGAHSAKPDAFYDMVERTCPAPAYLKLFARSGRANWISWGDEVEQPGDDEP